MEDKKRIISSRLPFVLLLTCALCIRLAYVFILPLGQTVRFHIEGLNDEPSHLNYVHYLAKHKHFPVQSHSARETDSFVRNEFEYYQPPVYYVIGASLERVFGAKNSMTACRILSFLCGVLSLLVIKRIFSRCGFSTLISDSAVLFAAFFPGYAYFCSVVSNDSLSWLISLLLAMEFTLVKTPDLSYLGSQAWPSSIRTGALLGLGMLVKSSLFIYHPVVLAFFLYCWAKSRDTRWLGGLFVSFTISVLFAAPWYLHNLHVYGSIFAFGVGNGPAQNFLFSKTQFIRFCFMTYKFFWFPMQNIPPSHSAANVLRLEALLLLASMALLAYYVKSPKRFSFYTALCVSLVVVNIAAYIKFNMYWDNAEGRYFFPSLVPMLMFFCIPVSHFCRRFGVEFLVIPFVCAEALLPYVNLFLVQ